MSQFEYCIKNYRFDPKYHHLFGNVNEHALEKKVTANTVVCYTIALSTNYDVFRVVILQFLNFELFEFSIGNDHDDESFWKNKKLKLIFVLQWI